MQEKTGQQQKKRRLGDIINAASKARVPFSLNVAGRTFDLFVHPLGSEDLKNVGKAIDEKGVINDDVLKVIVARSIRDGEGTPVWESPNDIDVEPVTWGHLRLEILRVQFGISLTDLKPKAEKSKEG